MVISKLFDLSGKFLVKIEWWVQVTVMPDDSKIIVFIKGISNGLNGLIPKGGHNCPISIVGARAEWK